MAFYNGMLDRDEEIEIVGDHLEECTNCSARLSEFSPSCYEREFREVMMQEDSFDADVRAILDEQLTRADETSALISEKVAPPVGVGENKKDRFSQLQPKKRGHFLRCVKAFDEMYRREVAIKIPREGFITSVEHRDQFFFDCCSYKNLIHPHILPMLDFGAWDNKRCFFCTPWVDSISLNRWIESDEVDFLAALKAVAMVCDAVRHAHDNFVVHRHLDFRNLRVAAGGHVWITDFGFVFDRRYQFELFENHKSISPLLPSEFLEKDRSVDERSDVYSIGKVLELCITHATEADCDLVESLTPIVSRSTAQSRTVRYQKIDELTNAIVKAVPSLDFFRSAALDG